MKLNFVKPGTFIDVESEQIHHFKEVRAVEVNFRTMWWYERNVRVIPKELSTTEMRNAKGLLNFQTGALVMTGEMGSAIIHVKELPEVDVVL